MGKIMRFLLDDSGTAEATSIAIFIAAVGILMAAGVAVYYGAASGFFNTAGTTVNGYAARVPK